MFWFILPTFYLSLLVACGSTGWTRWLGSIAKMALSLLQGLTGLVGEYLWLFMWPASPSTVATAYVFPCITVSQSACSYSFFCFVHEELKGKQAHCSNLLQFSQLCHWWECLGLLKSSCLVLLKFGKHMECKLWVEVVFFLQVLHQLTISPYKLLLNYRHCDLTLQCPFGFIDPMQEWGMKRSRKVPQKILCFEQLLLKILRWGY